MDLVLGRYDRASDGVFGALYPFGEQTPSWRLSTLEHAYGVNSDGEWLPKLPAGTWTCQRGWHSLEHGWQGWTYQIMNVPDHTNMLFHPGNGEEDSDGCVLLGTNVVHTTVHGLPERWVVQSRRAFGVFMRAQAGCETFQLTVTDP